MPVFAFRHYAQDGGKFPPGALAELGVRHGELGERKAGMWPYLALIAGAIVVYVANMYFHLPAPPA